jgi:hypothetical protein
LGKRKSDKGNGEKRSSGRVQEIVYNGVHYNQKLFTEISRRLRKEMNPYPLHYEKGTIIKNPLGRGKT